MKSTREPFDDELRERPLQYTEEPDRDLWQNITPHIVSINPEPGWVVWSQRVSAIVMVGASLLFAVFPTSEDGPQATLLELKRSEPGREGEKIIDRQSSAASQEAAEGYRKEQSDDNAGGNDPRKSISQKTGMSDTLRIMMEGEKKFNKPIGTEGQTEEDVRKKWSDDTIKIISKKAVALDTLKKEEEKQRKKRTNQRHRSFTMYFTAMPTFGYQRIESNQTDNIIIESINRLPLISAKRLGIRVELGTEYPLTKRLKFF